MGMVKIVTAPPQSVQVADIIRREIATGRIKPGERLCPTREMAQRFGVGKQIAQSAFNILKKEGLIESHVGRGTVVRAGVRTVSERTVVLVLDGLGDEHVRLHRLLPAALLDQGYFSCLFDVGDTGSKAKREELRRVLRERPAALVVDGYSRFRFDVLDWLAPQTRLIFVKRFEGRRRDAASYVLADYEAAGRMAGEYLLGRGRRRLVMLNFRRQRGWTSDLLARGCEQAMAGRGVEFFREIVTEGLDEDALLAALLAAGVPDGIFCNADYKYGQVADFLTGRGLELGKDYDVVGFGNTPWAKAYRIASLDPGDEQLSRRVAELLVTGLEKPVAEQVAPVLRQELAGANS